MPTKADLDTLRKKLADRDAEVAQLQDQTRHYAQSYDKARAEFASARERMQRENERSQKREQAKLVTSLLDVLDSLDRSLESVKNQPPGQPFVDGVHMIRGQFNQALQQLGLQRFDGLGETFDPARHQAVTVMPVPDAAQHDKVVHSVSSGALVGDEVLRPASVVVGKFTGDSPVH